MDGFAILVKDAVREQDLEVRVPSHATVRDLKEAVAREWDTEADDQRVIYRGSELKDDSKPLRDILNVSASDGRFVLHCVPKTPVLRGRSASLSQLPELDEAPSTTPNPPLAHRIASTPNLGLDSNAAPHRPAPQPSPVASSPGASPAQSQPSRVFATPPASPRRRSLPRSGSAATPQPPPFPFPSRAAPGLGGSAATSAAAFPPFPALPNIAFPTTQGRARGGISPEVHEAAMAMLHQQSLIASAAAAAAVTAQVQLLQSLSASGLLNATPSAVLSGIATPGARPTPVPAPVPTQPTRLSPTSALGPIPGSAPVQSPTAALGAAGPAQRADLAPLPEGGQWEQGGEDEGVQVQQQPPAAPPQPQRGPVQRLGNDLGYIVKLALLVFILSQGAPARQVLVYAAVAFALFLNHTGRLAFLFRLLPVGRLVAALRHLQRPNALIIHQQRMVAEEMRNQEDAATGNTMQPRNRVKDAARHIGVTALAFVTSLNPAWDPVVAHHPHED